MLLRAVLVWVLIAGCEVLHGALRIKLLNRQVGDRRARQIGVCTGSLLNFLLTWLTLPWLGASTESELLWIGGLWFGLMMAFDLGFGRVVFRLTWARMARDFDPRAGGWLAFGMVMLFLSPLLAGALELTVR
jgi:hypothetical protein